MMFSHDPTELDALILVGDDPASAERCLAALVAVSRDVPLRTWVIELGARVEGRAQQQRSVWTRSLEASLPLRERVNRALSQGDAPLVLILDGSHATDADTIRALIDHVRSDATLAAAGLGALGRPRLASRPGSVGPALLLHRDALERVGALLVDSRFFGVQAEAEAWCRRAERAGARVQLSPARTRVAERAARTTPRLVLSSSRVDELREWRSFRGRLTQALRRGPHGEEGGAQRPGLCRSASASLEEALIARLQSQLG